MSVEIDKYSTYTLTELIELIRSKVPEGTSDDQISIEFNTENHSVYGYYDEQITDISMDIWIKQ